MSNFLKATNLNVRYGNVAALRGVDFHVDQGEIVTLIGPNGAGKTSTLMAISNLIDGKKTGFLVFEGQDIVEVGSDRKESEPAALVEQRLGLDLSLLVSRSETSLKVPGLLPQVPEDGLGLPDLGLVLQSESANDLEFGLDPLALPRVGRRVVSLA